MSEWDKLYDMFDRMEQAVEESEVSRETWTMADFVSGRSNHLWIEG